MNNTNDKENVDNSAQKADQKKPSPLPGLARSIGINAVLPIIIYHLLKNYSTVPELIAVALTGVPSILDSLVGIIRNKRIDIIAGFTLIAVALSLVFITLGGDPKVYLVRNSLILGTFGLLILLSLLLPGSIMYYSVRQITTGGNTEGIARFEEEWQKDYSVRKLIYILSFIWGVGLVLETGISISLVFLLNIELFLLISPFVQFGFYSLLMLLTLFFVNRLSR